MLIANQGFYVNPTKQSEYAISRKLQSLVSRNDTVLPDASVIQYSFHIFSNQQEGEKIVSSDRVRENFSSTVLFNQMPITIMDEPHWI